MISAFIEAGYRYSYTGRMPKRREDAYALQKLRETAQASPVVFARSAVECDASLASLFLCQRHYIIRVSFV